MASGRLHFLSGLSSLALLRVKWTQFELTAFILVVPCFDSDTFVFGGLVDWHNGVDELMPPEPADIEDHRSTSERDGVSTTSTAYSVRTPYSVDKARGLLDESEAQLSHLREYGRSPWQEQSPPRSSRLTMAQEQFLERTPKALQIGEDSRGTVSTTVHHICSCIFV